MLQRIDETAPLYYVDEKTKFSHLLLMSYEEDLPNRVEQNKLLVSTLKSFDKDTDVTLKILQKWHCHGSSELDEDGEYETDFIDCILWNGIASNIAEYCKKGDIVGVKGRVESKVYEKDDEKKYITEKKGINFESPLKQWREFGLSNNKKYSEIGSDRTKKIFLKFNENKDTDKVEKEKLFRKYIQWLLEIYQDQAFDVVIKTELVTTDVFIEEIIPEFNKNRKIKYRCNDWYGNW